MVKLGKLYFFNDQDPQAVKWFEKAITYDAEEIDAGCIDGELRLSRPVLSQWLWTDKITTRQ